MRMKATIAKSDWLTALACPAMAWHALRSVPVPPTEADRFRMQQGQEIGAMARKLYPDGFMIPAVAGRAPAQVTRESLADPSRQTFFEATVSSDPFVAKADILRRDDGAWHVLEVKSRFADANNIDDLVCDLAYTVMVFQRASFKVTRASLVLLSRNYRFDDGPERLFETVDVTTDVMARAAEFDATADGIAKLVFHDAPPTPLLSSACRGCPFFDSKCLGAGIPHTVLEIPGLHHKKLKRLSAEGIIDLSQLPNDLELNENQERSRNAALSGRAIIDHRLGTALATIAWPCHYVDFETVATVLPLYKGHCCNQQVLTQFSVHRRDALGAEPEHQEYLADAGKDCQRELAETLIKALDGKGAIVVYSSFERTRIKELRNAFPDLTAPLSAILGRLVDLLFFVTEFVSHPDFNGSYSIKTVLPVLVPELSYKGLAVRDGDTAIARFARMARGEISGDAIETTRRQLLEYCKLDTWAMLRLHEAMLQLAADNAAAPAGHLFTA
jgi:CRISPR/Cas system-associated exonuclease Cas4 (RecB family)